jgi:hypothetical protein
VSRALEHIRIDNGPAFISQAIGRSLKQFKAKTLFMESRRHGKTFTRNRSTAITEFEHHLPHWSLGYLPSRSSAQPLERFNRLAPRTEPGELTSWTVEMV